MRILIVDDSGTSRMLLETILMGAGYSDLLTASSAQECLDHLKRCNLDNGGEPVDLILMDIVMPDINGIEAVGMIKSNRKLSDIPIIMVTVKDEEASLKKAFEAGAIDYIQKPVRKIELRARVGSVLKLREEMKQRQAREKELEELTLKLEQITKLDGLTGVPNRRSFDETFQREWSRAQRAGFWLSVLMIDIDFFKYYNDEYGHLEGDRCLQTVAQAIVDTLKRPADFMARYGGEEFVVILPATSIHGAAAIGEEIRQSVLSLTIAHAKSDVCDRVTVSLGAASLKPRPDLQPKDLLDNADKALYQAKAAGRNRIMVNSEAPDDIVDGSALAANGVKN